MNVKGMVIAGGIVLGLCTVGGVLVNMVSDAPPPANEISVGAGKAPARPPHDVKKSVPPSRVQPKPTKAPPATIRQGTWEVGKDVKAGKYRTAGAIPSAIVMCYWDVRNDSEVGEIAAQGVVDQENEPGRVTLTRGQFFMTTGCADWTAISS